MRGFLRVVIRPFNLLKKSTVVTLVAIMLIGAFAVYAIYVDRTVYTTQELVIIPGKVTSDTWLGMESVLSQDISEYSLYQDFTEKNSAYISELGIFSAQKSENAPTPSDPNEVLINPLPGTATTTDSTQDGGIDTATNSPPTVESQPPEEITTPAAVSEPEPVAPTASSPTSFNSSVLPVWGVFTKTSSLYPLAQAIITEEAQAVVVKDEPEITPEPAVAPAVTPESEPSVPDAISSSSETIAVPEPTELSSSSATTDSASNPEPVTEATTETQSEIPAVEDTSNDYVLSACLPEAGCATHSMLFSDFLLPDFESGTVLDSIQLRLSLAAKTKNNSGATPQRFLIEYTYDTSTSAPAWITASVLDIGDEISNSINGGYFLLSLNAPPKAGEIANLQIKVTYQGNVSNLETAYVEGVWLEVTSGKFFEEGVGEEYSDTLTYGRD